MFNKNRNRSGFTIIELLLVIAIMTVTLSIMIPVSTDYQKRNDLDLAQTTFAQSVRRAQQLSMASDGDSQWGVATDSINGNIVVYKGATFIGRDTSFDENYDLSKAITVSGQSEYDFTKLLGSTTSGTVTFTNGNYVKNVSVNVKGIVNY